MSQPPQDPKNDPSIPPPIPPKAGLKTQAQADPSATPARPPLPPGALEESRQGKPNTPAQSPPPPPKEIEAFGPYRFLKKIGHGGMAEVFLARRHDDPSSVAPIVIKRLHPQLEQDREAVDLFLTEADVTSMLEHPNVIRVYDSGEVDGRYFMAMEYVHGKDLEQIFERFRYKNILMEPKIAAHIVCEILRGLHHVHHAKTPSGRPLGIVHRDLTPSNIYISAKGHIKLGDFGVAKLVGVEGWTMSGSLKGKLGYLSPEQVAGGEPSLHIDLWATGIMLYELVSGQRAFIGDNELDIMLQIKAAKVPKAKHGPKPLRRIIARALHKKLKKRYESADAFLIELLQFNSLEGRPPSPEELVQYLTASLA